MRLRLFSSTRLIWKDPTVPNTETMVGSKLPVTVGKFLFLGRFTFLHSTIFRTADTSCLLWHFSLRYGMEQTSCASDLCVETYSTKTYVSALAVLEG